MSNFKTPWPERIDEIILLFLILSTAGLIFLSAWVPNFPKNLNPQDFLIYSHPIKTTNQGTASWYDYSLKNAPNYSKTHFTAASRDYPRGTMLRVCIPWEEDRERHFENSYLVERCVDVRVNDTVVNPEVILDLSSSAFRELSPLSRGLIQVEIEKL